MAEPAPSAGPPRARRTRRRLRAGGAVAVVLLVAVAAWRTSSGGDDHDYRTALVATDSAEQTVDLTGTVTPVSQASVGFVVGGEVATVAVKVGQVVRTGQTLAAIDPSDLQAKVTQDEASVAAAKATLASHEASQASSAGSTSSSSSGLEPASYVTTVAASQSAAASRDGTGGTGASAAARVAQLQAALLQAVHTADVQQQQVDALLAAARTTCQAVVEPTSGGSTGSARSGGKTAASGSATPSAHPSVSASPAPSPGGGRKAAIKACDDALAAVLTAQGELSKDQAAVSSAENALAAALAALAKATPTSPPASGSGSGSGGSGGSGSSGGSGTGRSGESGSGGSASAGNQSGGSTTITAEQLAADQAAVDAAQAQLVEDQQEIQQATLVSPISGTVAAVNVVAGQQVTGSTTRADVQVVNTGSFEVVGSVSDTTVTAVKVGQPVTVTPDGATKPLTGHVVAVGLLPTSSSGGYPVTVGLDGHPTGLYAGSGSDVSIVVGSARNAMTVPTSAVRTVGGRHVVTVLRAGRTTAVQVTLGVVGPERTQVTAGLAAGDRVVLADLSQPLPANNTNGFRGLGGGGFGPPGGGGGGATTRSSRGG